MIHSERVLRLMAAKGLTQTELAKRVGVTQGAIAKIVGTNPTGSRYLHVIARELGTSPAYLTGEIDDPAEGALPVPSTDRIAEELDLVAVQEISLEFGLGATVLHDDHETIRRYVPRDWMLHFTKSPPQLIRFARGKGESMYPTIGDGDLLVIDLGQTRMTAQDEIWACGYGDLGGVKRLRSVGQGMIKVMSDNPHVSDELVHVDELRIIGRVCGNLRKM